MGKMKGEAVLGWNAEEKVYKYMGFDSAGMMGSATGTSPATPGAEAAKTGWVASSSSRATPSSSRRRRRQTFKWADVRRRGRRGRRRRGQVDEEVVALDARIPPRDPLSQLLLGGRGWRGCLRLARAVAVLGLAAADGPRVAVGRRRRAAQALAVGHRPAGLVRHALGRRASRPARSSPGATASSRSWAAAAWARSIAPTTSSSASPSR